MASRNRTTKFVELRAAKKQRLTPQIVPVQSQKKEAKQSLLGADSSSNDISTNGEVDLESGNSTHAKSLLAEQPAWMHARDEVLLSIEQIKKKMGMLSNSHKSHLLPQFGMDDRLDEEQTIEILTGDITKMFQTAQLKTQSLGSSGILEQEEMVRKNLQSQLALELQQLSQQFRKDQKDYLQRLRGRQAKGVATFNITDDGDDTTGVFDVSFSAGQKQKTADAEKAVIEREREILQIAKSINELSEVFKELAIMVIEQGTVLDRIDYNLEQVTHNVSEGVVQLQEASKIQKSYRNKLVMMLLCLGILILIVVAFVRGMVHR